ncbi:uncharacterized protein JCM15063_002110 [Sporobolomyces koalae]|uniref:uncharacterized protein n=1 Tax=Sporobolomyces koalae TaxID=500713 RepID=UPI00317CB1D7
MFLRFYYGAQAQGIDRIGFEVFIKGNGSTSTFITRYLLVVLFIAIYFTARLYWSSTWVPLPAIDFFSGSRDNDESEEPVPTGFWQKLWHALS